MGGHYYAFIKVLSDNKENNEEDSKPAEEEQESKEDGSDEIDQEEAEQSKEDDNDTGKDNNNNESDKEQKKEKSTKDPYLEGRGKWFRFDDSYVSAVSEEYVLTQAFGSAELDAQGNPKSSTNAYMVMYRRIDPARNQAFVSNDEVSPDLMKQVTQEDERKAIETDPNMVKIDLYCGVQGKDIWQQDPTEDSSDNEDDNNDDKNMDENSKSEEHDDINASSTSSTSKAAKASGGDAQTPDDKNQKSQSLFESVASHGTDMFASLYSSNSNATKSMSHSVHRVHVDTTVPEMLRTFWEANQEVLEGVGVRDYMQQMRLREFDSTTGTRRRILSASDERTLGTIFSNRRSLTLVVECRPDVSEEWIPWSANDIRVKCLRINDDSLSWPSKAQAVMIDQCGTVGDLQAAFAKKLGVPAERLLMFLMSDSMGTKVLKCLNREGNAASLTMAAIFAQTTIHVEVAPEPVPDRDEHEALAQMILASRTHRAFERGRHTVQISFNKIAPLEDGQDEQAYLDAAERANNNNNNSSSSSSSNSATFDQTLTVSEESTLGELKELLATRVGVPARCFRMLEGQESIIAMLPPREFRDMSMKVKHVYGDRKFLLKPGAPLLEGDQKIAFYLYVRDAASENKDDNSQDDSVRTTDGSLLQLLVKESMHEETQLADVKKRLSMVFEQLERPIDPSLLRLRVINEDSWGRKSVGRVLHDHGGSIKTTLGFLSDNTKPVAVQILTQPDTPDTIVPTVRVWDPANWTLTAPVELAVSKYLTMGEFAQLAAPLLGANVDAHALLAAKVTVETADYGKLDDANMWTVLTHPGVASNPLTHAPWMLGDSDQVILRDANVPVKEISAGERQRVRDEYNFNLYAGVSDQFPSDAFFGSVGGGREVGLSIKARRRSERDDDTEESADDAADGDKKN
eukprot:TRINITY_DN66112_c1_g1_i1.p1 TRINITY_DN66112_c1_g1~~TRINITY_DN66112_c1_g1_i1.p1  ORF type:complete len:974 (+),score=559.80 TRINITY_DN66112_c1_g1_i1:181-2922(+)